MKRIFSILFVLFLICFLVSCDKKKYYEETQSLFVTSGELYSNDGNDDNEEIADKMVKKLIGLRIFEDENGKTNLALKDVGGELLLVSQFTLMADVSHGNRPSFTDAGSPQKANELYEYIVEQCRTMVDVTETGKFGADMKVDLLNDGPFSVELLA